MSTTSKSMAGKNVKRGFGDENLSPTPANARILGRGSYAMSWVGAVININSFMMGAALVPPTGKLNLVQSTLAMVIGITIIVCFMTLNGEPGQKYGIPFIVHARPAFGMKGALFPGLIRAVPCILWYGIQTYIGAEAINTVLNVLFEFDNLFVCFIAFLGIQIALSCLGFKGIKWIENVGAIFIIGALSVMFTVIYRTYKAEFLVNLVQFKGSWGFPFLAGMCTFAATYATYVVTMGDIIRELDTTVPKKTTFWLHIIGTMPFTMFMALIGLLCSGTTGTWDPIAVFTEILPNKPLLVMTLIFIAFAQITTNVLMNVVPASYVLMSYTKIKYKMACLIIGLLAGVTMPWKLTTGSGFTMFVSVASAFLIPTSMVMIADYYFIRQRSYDVDMLYDTHGAFSGINWNGIIAVLVGTVIALTFVSVSWLASIAPTIIVYLLLTKYSRFSRQFLIGTIWDKRQECSGEKQ